MARLLSRLRDFGVAGLPTALLTWSQRACEQIEAAFAAQDAVNTQLAAQLAQIIAAQAAAAAAQSTADAVHVNDSISSSWTSPGTILSASDAGTDATVTVTNHTRKYNDATAKPVTGASLTGLAYSTVYFVYCDDPTRAGGAVTFHATTDPNTALPGAASGRHYCGEITTPASGGGATSGGVSPPGSGGQLSGSSIP